MTKKYKNLRWARDLEVLFFILVLGSSREVWDVLIHILGPIALRIILGEKQGINNKLKYPSSYQSLICQVWYKELLINCGYGALRQICYLLSEPTYRKPIFVWFLPPGYLALGVKEWNICFRCRNSWIKWPLGKPRYFKHLVLKCRNRHSISLYVRTSHR